MSHLNLDKRIQLSSLDMFLMINFNYPECLQSFTTDEKAWFMSNKDEDIVFALHMIKQMKSSGFKYPSLIDEDKIKEYIINNQDETNIFEVMDKLNG